jgi:methionine salvage enolase-phosphatase E1
MGYYLYVYSLGHKKLQAQAFQISKEGNLENYHCFEDRSTIGVLKMISYHPSHF